MAIPNKVNVSDMTSDAMSKLAQITLHRKRQSNNNLNPKKGESVKVLLKKALATQKIILDDFGRIKKDYKKVRSIFETLQQHFIEYQRDKNKPKFDKLNSPFGRSKNGKSGSGGLFGLLSALGLGALGGGLGIISGFLMKSILKPALKIIKKAAKGVVKGIYKTGKSILKTILSASGKSIGDIPDLGDRNKRKPRGKRGIFSKVKDLIKKGGSSSKSIFNKSKKLFGRIGSKASSRLMSSAVNGQKLGLGKQIGKVAVRQVAGFIGRGAIAAGGAALGYPLLIASAAAAVGFGTYKLGRYLKLSERLDKIISKITAGKYNGIVDLLLGVADGSVGKDLFSWVKDKVSELFDDAIEFLKDKTDSILGKFSPFKDDDKNVTKDAGVEKGSSASNYAGGSEINSPNNNISNNDKTFNEIKQDLSSFYQNSISGGGGGSVSSMPSSSSSANDSSSSNNAATVKLSQKDAMYAITNGVATHVTSGFSSRRKHPKDGKVKPHNGVDIRADPGTKIYAIEDGIFGGNGSAKSKKGGGLQAWISGTPSGRRYGFAHLSKWLVKKGDRVKKGQAIALSGNSGASTGPHIHFTVSKPNSSAKVNPVGIKVPEVAKNQGDDGEGLHFSSATNNDEIKPKTCNVFSDTNNVLLKSVHENNEVKTISNSTVMNQINNSYSSAEPNNTSSSANKTTPKASKKASKPNSIIPNKKPSSAAVRGHVPDIEDPRGALRPEIMKASYSPLFL